MIRNGGEFNILFITFNYIFGKRKRNTQNEGKLFFFKNQLYYADWPIVLRTIDPLYYDDWPIVLRRLANCITTIDPLYYDDWPIVLRRLSHCITTIDQLYYDDWPIVLRRLANCIMPIVQLYYALVGFSTDMYQDRRIDSS